MVNSEMLLGRIDDLATEVNTLTRGLGELVSAMEDHSEMLARILEACSTEPGESPVVEALERVVGAIEQQSAFLVGIGETLDNLGPGIEAAVVRSVQQSGGVE